jgi:hypothetical protein
MIVLSGATQDRSKVIALEEGADDYVVKPFSPEELVARVHALLRRVGQWTPPADTNLHVRHAKTGRKPALPDLYRHRAGARLLYANAPSLEHFCNPMRLRVLWMVLGALLVAATFTFPLWLPILENRGAAPVEAFPDLATQLQDDFLNLPQEQQRAYLAFDAQDHAKALEMVTAALAPRTTLSDEEQAMPELNAPTMVASGTFQRVDAVRWAQGTVNIFRDANNALTMRLEGFSMLNAPNLRVYLSAAEAPQTQSEMTVTEIEPVDIAPLRATDGSQIYPLPDVDLALYRSVVVYSQSLDLIYTYAPLFTRQ